LLHQSRDPAAAIVVLLRFLRRHAEERRHLQRLSVAQSADQFLLSHLRS
jgi:hypothetical protein